MNASFLRIIEDIANLNRFKFFFGKHMFHDLLQGGLQLTKSKPLGENGLISIEPSN
jgi:hypothetical protein